jgi:acetoin utilization deacetylase AcuC-like enzyme
MRTALLVGATGLTGSACLDQLLGGFSLTTPVYTEIGRRLAAIPAPVLICQEGGNNLDVLGESVRRLLKGLEEGRRAG